MAHVDGEQLALARVYAGALLHLAEARGQAEQLLTELLDFAEQVATNADLGRLLSSADVDGESRRKVLERLLRGKCSDLLVDALQVLNRKERIGLIGAVVEAYRLAIEGLRGRVEVHVSTAVPLSEPLREKLAALVTKRTGKQADLVEHVDESLLGGVVMRIGDRKFDASIATRLKHLAAALLDRATREIREGRFCSESVR